VLMTHLMDRGRTGLKVDSTRGNRSRRAHMKHDVMTARAHRPWEETIGGARRGRAAHQPSGGGGCTAPARVARRLPASEPGAGTWPCDRVPGADLPVLSRCSPGALPVIWERELVGGASRSFLSCTWPPRLADATEGAGGAKRGRRLSAPSDGWDATDGSGCGGFGVGSG